MASTVIIVVSMSALIGFMVQEIASGMMLRTHNQRIKFTHEQLATKYTAAFEPPYPDAELNLAMRETVQEEGLIFSAAIM